MKEPEFIGIKTKEMTVPLTEQYYLEVQEKQKFDVLCRLLDIHSPELAIVFGRTKRRVDELFEALSKRGYSAEGIHGDLTQARRDVVMRHFKEGMTDILVATDVAARGLDIRGVTHVYNFDIPQDPEGYVHRIGRTGRAGKAGLATTLVTPREIGFLRVIEQITKRKIIRIPIPSINDVVEGQQQITIDKLMQTVGEGDYLKYKELAQGLLENTDSVTLLAAALKLLTKEPVTLPVKLTDEAPWRFKKNDRNPRFEATPPQRKFDKYKGKSKGKGHLQYNKKSVKESPKAKFHAEGF
jgi:ATP-dependent RNA helicase DeaD